MLGGERERAKREEGQRKEWDRMRSSELAERERERDRQTDTQTDTQTHTQRQRDTDTDTERERGLAEPNVEDLKTVLSLIQLFVHLWNRKNFKPSFEREVRRIRIVCGRC